MAYQRISLGLVFAFSLFFQLSCGESPDSQTSPASASGSVSGASATAEPNSTLTFSVSLELDASNNNYDMTTAFAEDYQLPLTIEAGNLTVDANNFPKMVYRVCQTDSSTASCDFITDALGLEIDVVVDSCGRLVDDADCGASDDTYYAGTLSESGDMTINDISLRLRLFLVNDEGDGTSALDSDEGLVTLNRIVVDLTTDSATSGDLSAQGLALNETDVTLVAAGTLSSTTPELGRAPSSGQGRWWRPAKQSRQDLWWWEIRGK
jgi:hypothetical protein